MKKLLLGLSIMLACSSCEEWLTVQPGTTVSAETLFASDEGLIQGLAGAYYRAQAVYEPNDQGASFIEIMANTYYYDPLLESDGYYFSIHMCDYSDTQDYTNEVFFMQMYAVVANLNSLLNNMEKSRDNLTPETYKMVRGEAYGLRACCHLDLMRIYGPVPSQDDGETYLPYVRENDVNRYAYNTFDEFMDYVQQDLDSAEMFLGEVDPVLTSSFEDTEVSTNTWPYRKSRCNYYGVLALQARAAMWRGDNERALRYARLVKEATNSDGSSKVYLTTAEMMSNYYNSGYVTDRTFYTEHIFGIKNENYDGTDRYNVFVLQSVSSSPDFLVEMYGDDYRSDMRYQYFWGSTGYYLRDENGNYVWGEDGSAIWVTTGGYIRKYSDFAPSVDSPHNFPIIRLPEMYFIIMECGTLAEANEAYQEYCDARNLTYVPLTEEDRVERVMMESLREYVAEGQNFYTYKRHNVANMVGASTSCSAEQYIMPLPEAEYSDVI